MALPNWATTDRLTALAECLDSRGQSTGTTDSTIAIARALSQVPSVTTNQIIAAGILLGISGGGGGGDLTEVGVPASSAAPGAGGQYAVDGDYFYIYDTGVSEWRRSLLEQW
jgi:hypothetical protein